MFPRIPEERSGPRVESDGPLVAPDSMPSAHEGWRTEPSESLPDLHSRPECAEILAGVLIDAGSGPRPTAHTDFLLPQPDAEGIAATKALYRDKCGRSISDDEARQALGMVMRFLFLINNPTCSGTASMPENPTTTAR